MGDPSCIDLILTNKSLFPSLSGFPKLIICTMKSNFHKQKPIIMKYRNHKDFNIYLISMEGFHDKICEEFETFLVMQLKISTLIEPYT